jgi:glyoxylase-like metal-dependent hydrolase (beta-lactamase superfamily II)
MMKNYLSAVLFLIIFNSATAQTQALKNWFTCSEVSPGVFRIDDNNAVNVYLIIGKDSALVVDTGMGSADLISQLKKLTSKPLIVINTHGHSDHTGANYQFKKVYIHPEEIQSAINTNTPEQRQSAAQNMLRGQKPSQGETYKGPIENTQYMPVREGFVFNLGGRTIKVIETPGHTPGELVLLDVENKLLFTGDNDNSLVWLFLPTCKPLHVYLASLEKLQSRLSEFTTLFPGHGIPEPSDFINDQVKCVKGIINGTLESKPYKSFAGDAALSTWGRASVAFDPKNL